MKQFTLPAQGWKPRPYQLPLLQYMSQDRRGLRAVIAWHRRAGKDLTCINITAIKAFQRVGTYLFIGPFNNQIRRIVWEGMDGGGKRFLHYFPKEAVERKSEAEMRLYLSNGSVIQLLGADNPDKLVGINPVGIIFSEFSLCDPQSWELTRPILAENGGWALFNGTPRGQNWFYDIKNTAEREPDWFCSHLSAADTKAISPDVLRKEREQMSEARFQSEFMTSFNTPIEGSYYGSIISRLYKKGQVLETITPEPALEVHTAWDLGMDDSTTIWFCQIYKGEPRLLHFFEDNGEGLSYYVRYLDKWAALNDVTYGKHYAPHDIKVRELGTGRSRLETARKMGLKFTPVKKLAITDGIDAVRSLLPKCWFSQTGCAQGIKYLKDYRKEFDSMNQVYKKSPVHDSASHGADAFRTLAVGLKLKDLDPDKEKRKPQTSYKEQNIDF